MQQLKVWLLATRPQFFSMIVLSIFLGTALAWYEQQVFAWPSLILMLLAGLTLQAAANLLNDYFDHLNQADSYNINPLTPFAGGSRVIQTQTLTAKQVYYFGISCLIMGGILGGILLWMHGVILLLLLLLAALLLYFYSAPPIALHSRGLGELAVGISFAPLAILAAYYVQAQNFSILALIVSIPIMLLVMAVLYINEFADFLPDKQAGKKTLVVRLGLAEARIILVYLIILSFIIVIMGVITDYFPLMTIVVLVLIFDVKQILSQFYQHYANPTELLPAIKKTIELHSIFSLVLIASFALPQTCPL
jgi:1,4-dihydroxy-2-naphthoate polyprenyltransferase